MKESFHWRYRNAWVDFQFDGMFPRERIKGRDKRNLRKRTSKLVWKTIEME